MAASRQQVIAAQIGELIRTIQEHQVADVDSVLGELTESGVEYVPGARHAGITIAVREGKVRTVAATGEYPKILDEIQQRRAQGPCLTAAWEHHITKIDDMASESRWRAFCDDAIEETPIRSVIAFQLYADKHTMGALNFYAERTGAFNADAVEAGLVVATHTALAWSLLRRDQQFRSALASRDVIGQAKGMLMERFKIDAVQAFEVLKRLSQTSNTALVEIAHDLVNLQCSPEGIERGNF